jgi:hypothetical protein
MANWVIPNEGKILALQRWLQTTGASVEDYVLKTFKSNTTVGDASTLSDFTISTFTGYADVSITHGTFPAPTITSNIANSNPGNGVFTCTAGGAENMYGALLVGVTSGKIIAGVNFDTVRVMSAGATETITPNVAFKTFA